MDFPLQVHGGKYIFPIPDGLKELSSDIVREVLRHQPNHITGFVADYLETMLTVRQNAREAAVVICDTFEETYFYNELYKAKNVTRKQANFYATMIQASWRGYVVRRKISDWLKKKKKFEEDKERKRSIKIQELLETLGITDQEAMRAAGVIQDAYRSSKRGKWITDEFGERWVEEVIPFGQRVREGDRALGRFDRWDKEDFGDFFEMTDDGSIKYDWPTIGQLQRVTRKEVPKDVPIVEFFAMRDLEGKEQYSYLLKTQSEIEVRGEPIGVLAPLPRGCILDHGEQVDFVKPEYKQRMGHYTYIFRGDFDREELENYHEILKTHKNVNDNEVIGEEFDYDPHWVLPRILVKIKREYLLDTDIEVTFGSIDTLDDAFTFRAETVEASYKVIRHILRNQCLTIEEGMIEAANMTPYKFQETGRIFPVPNFAEPSFVQKIKIIPESDSAKNEFEDSNKYVYVFIPRNHKKAESFKKLPVISISITRFHGYHSDYKGSAELENAVFILGPKVTTPDGKPFTYESIFWNEYGEEAWYQLLQNPEVDSHDVVSKEAESKEAESEEEEVEEEMEEVNVQEEEEESATEREYTRRSTVKSAKSVLKEKQQKEEAGEGQEISESSQPDVNVPEDP